MKRNAPIRIKMRQWVNSRYRRSCSVLNSAKSECPLFWHSAQYALGLETPRTGVGAPQMAQWLWTSASTQYMHIPWETTGSRHRPPGRVGKKQLHSSDDRSLLSGNLTSHLVLRISELVFNGFEELCGCISPPAEIDSTIIIRSENMGDHRELRPLIQYHLLMQVVAMRIVYF